MQSMVQKVYYSSGVLEKSAHYHDCHQIILIVKGSVEFGINGEILHAGEGDAVIFSRYENHSVRVLSSEYARYVLQIAPEVVNRSSHVYSLLSDRPGGFCNVISVARYAGEIVSCFRQLMREQKEAEKLTDEMEQCVVKQLLILLFRCAQSNFCLPSDELVMDLKRYFESSYGERHTLQALSKKYNLSVSALSHRFRTATGMAVMDYLLSCRMAYAKRMLALSELSVGEIVEKCGFSDSSNFSRTFKKLNGMTPSQFREKYGKQAEGSQ